MTVYVIQEAPGRNILSASDYGELKVVLPSSYNLFLSVGPTVSRIKRKLKDFSDDDYLLLMGDPACIGVACAVASDLNRGKFKVLKWDREEQKYYPVEVDLYMKGERDE